MSEKKNALIAHALKLKRGLERLGVKAKLYTLQEANKVGEFRLDYWIPKEKSEVLTLQRTAGSRR